MAQVLNLTVPNPNRSSSLTRTKSFCSSTRTKSFCSITRSGDWSSLLQRFKCNGRFSCLFSNNRREEQARKALESALGGKKSDFEKWNNEIKKREEAGGGGDAGGGGGWFGWGGRFGWNNGDNFWQEAQQTGLAILGIIAIFLIIAKGEVMLAVVLNPLLFALRGTRNGLTLITSQVLRRTSPPNTRTEFDAAPRERVSAKEQVLRKWGSG